MRRRNKIPDSDRGTEESCELKRTVESCEPLQPATVEGTEASGGARPCAKLKSGGTGMALSAGKAMPLLTSASSATKEPLATCRTRPLPTSVITHSWLGLCESWCNNSCHAGNAPRITVANQRASISTTAARRAVARRRRDVSSVRTCGKQSSVPESRQVRMHLSPSIGRLMMSL